MRYGVNSSSLSIKDDEDCESDQSQSRLARHIPRSGAAFKGPPWKHGSACEEAYGRPGRPAIRHNSLAEDEQGRRGSKLPSAEEACPLWPRADT